jgi:exopolyphosphatase / guanosine-5'-triphosphate,3'-diphosphate pyrophosphatase
MTSPVAAIDIGTNTILCLVARRAADGGLEVLDDQCATARLGAGRLDDAAIERALGVLQRQLARAEDLGVSRVRAVGTAVLRRATDAQGFLDACRERLGLEVEVLPEAEEARVGYLAVIDGNTGAGNTVVVDVGGGSTEVVTDAGERCLSAPIGAVSLTERYLGLDGSAPSRPGGLGALAAEIARACEVFPVGAAARAPVVLLGGSACNLACLELAPPAFDHELAEGAELRSGAAAYWAEQLARTPLNQRAVLPIEADRAEILPAGLACIAGVLARLGAGQARVSGRGLRYGVARGLLGLGMGSGPQPRDADSR